MCNSSVYKISFKQMNVNPKITGGRSFTGTTWFPGNTPAFLAEFMPLNHPS